MYGTLGSEVESEGPPQQQQQPQQPASQHQRQQQTLFAAANNNPNSGQQSTTIQDQEAEARRRRRIYSHCHIQSADHDHDAELESRRSVDKSARRRLIVASITCLVFMVAEVVGGVLSNSLAIATDAAHLLTDFASFMISLFAIWLSSRPASRKMSFGWYRAEVIGALLSVLMIWLVTGLLVYMAVERLRSGEIVIDSFVMVVTASAGLLVNIIMAIALNVDGHGHGHFHSHGGGHSHGHSHGGHSHHKQINNHSHLDHVDEGVTDDEPCDDDDEDQDYEDQSRTNSHLHHHQSSVTIDCSMKEGLTTKSSLQANESHRLAIPSQLNKLKRPKNSKKKRQRACRSQGQDEASGRGRSNINVRAAFIHVIGDFLQSLGVLIAALVIHFEPSYAIVDPICTFLFSFIVLITTINIIRDATNVLMEGIPDGINFIEVHERLQSLPNVIRVHNLRIWSLSLDKIAISTHLVIDTKNTTSAQALKSAIDFLKGSYNFFEVTIQIEEYREDMRDCEHCQDDEILPEIVVSDGPTTTTTTTTTTTSTTTPPSNLA